MSFLRTILSRACNQYSCLVAPRWTGVAQVRKMDFCTEIKKTDEPSMVEEQGAEIENIQETNTETLLEETKQNMASNNDMRPGYGNIPTADIYETTYDGVRFDELPLVHITCTPNNTKGYAKSGDRLVCIKTGGSVGFKNKKKSSNVAAQTVGQQIGQIMVKKKMKNVRVEMAGIGMHRLTALRGLVVGGLNIISIADRTYPNFHLRPRKPRRV